MEEFLAKEAVTGRVIWLDFTCSSKLVKLLLGHRLSEGGVARDMATARKEACLGWTESAFESSGGCRWQVLEATPQPNVG
jgi:hypothetical protein